MIRIRFYIALFAISFSGLTAHGQQFFDFSFERDLTVQVNDSNGIPLKNPWAGGINSVHFNEIDLNFDGIIDLVTFDTQTDRIRTYINSGTANTIDYTYAPQYEKGFPKIYSWMKLRDFNGDGKPDIFTYNFGGIKVYINVSSPTNGIVFKLYSPMINAYQAPYTSNIMVTDVDYPAIFDMDGDGDLDILVFFGLGSFIKLYENLSMDSTNTCDTLWYRLKHNCWGYIMESEISNSITLNIDVIDPAIGDYCNNVKSSLPFQSFTDKNRKLRHTGSTMTMLDLNNDGLIDMLLGDTDYPNVIALYNQGTTDTARITSQDTFFPSYNESINIFDLTNVDYIDVDNDGIKDMVVGVMDPGVSNHRSDNIYSTWMYKNIGTNSNPVFSLQTKEFLQKEMIEVGANAYPVLYDYNGNGLKDLFIGSYGIRDTSYWDPWLNLESKYRAQIWLYENTGTPTQPEFTFVTDDFANVSALNITGAYPAFADLDGDGDADMLVGDTTGQLHLFINNAGAGNPMSLTYSSSSYQGIDVGMFSAPQLVDVDNDGLTDLLIGYRTKIFKNNIGYNYWRSSIAYYKNTGTLSTPAFSKITDTLGGIDVRTGNDHYYYGYSQPMLFRDSTGKASLFVGCAGGMVFYYKDIDSNLSGTFTMDSSYVYIKENDTFYSAMHFKDYFGNAETINENIRSIVAVDDLNNDGLPDMIVGNFAGGLTFYKGILPLGIGIDNKSIMKPKEMTLYPNPASDQVYIAFDQIKPWHHVKIDIYNISGKKVTTIEKLGNDIISVNTSGLSNGVYIISATISERNNSNSFAYKRLIIAR